MNDRQLARRSLLASVGLGVGAGLISGVASIPPAAAVAVEILSAEYWAHKGQVKLNLWRKRRAPTIGGESPPVLFLVHGSSLSARSSYDLSTPGKDEYSLMNVFAGEGFDVWTMDHDGYGHSGSSGNNSDIASGVADLQAAVDVVERETGRSKFHFFGESSGAIRAAAFAQREPVRVDRLILGAFTYKGTGSAEIGRRQRHIDELRAAARRRRDAGTIRSIFSRDGHPGAYDPAMTEALIATELRFGDSVPSGTYLDMAANLPLADPTKVLSPVLMTRGEWDGNSTNDDLLDFFRQLPTGDRQFAILPNTAHSEVLARNRHLLWHVMRAFLTMPPVQAA